jgi:hypothetical protein
MDISIGCLFIENSQSDLKRNLKLFEPYDLPNLSKNGSATGSDTFSRDRRWHFTTRLAPAFSRTDWPLNTSVPDPISETLDPEYLENGQCGGWEKWIYGRGEWNNTENNYEIEVGPSKRSQQGL